MAHLWLHADISGQPTANGWNIMPLDDGVVLLRSAGLLRSAREEQEAWILVGPASVRVNGVPLDTGIHVLRDQDELRVGASRAFFSTETLPTIVPFPSERPKVCPRCKLDILPGTPAVGCPQCRIWHHQSEEYPCWTYNTTCTNCDQPTALEADFRWSPELL